jgi:hypothetical protein
MQSISCSYFISFYIPEAQSATDTPTQPPSDSTTAVSSTSGATTGASTTGIEINAAHNTKFHRVIYNCIFMNILEGEREEWEMRERLINK